MSKNIPPLADTDTVETQEWIEALDSVVECNSAERAQFLLDRLWMHAMKRGIAAPQGMQTPYFNTLPATDTIPEDIHWMKSVGRYLRWNAIVMVMRAGKVDASLGGHIASYASTATLYEVGFNYFFHAPTAQRGGDLIYFQGHSSPGIYARAYLEGRLQEKDLDGFRQEISRQGLSSYPHPWLMPHFWEFPTVSMGLGPISGIYQAQLLKYLHNRGLVNTQERKVWVFCGDGEMGEPESMGQLNIAARERLDNLIFVINCNLQRLDGPVWGNGQIIQEYEAMFRGAGWNVIKVIWSSDWDPLFTQDKKGLLAQRISELIDGEYQDYSAKDGAYFREHFFGKYPELLALVSDKSDADLKMLRDGGHDPQKVYAAYAAAVQHQGQPTVILVKTVKGYGMGSAGEGMNTAHQAKKMDLENLQLFCQRFSVPISENDIEQLPYLKPAADSPEMKFLMARRQALGGFLPARRSQSEKLPIPTLEIFRAQLEDSGDREFSTTMAFVRMLSALLKDKAIAGRIVPIVADESRTFGMEGLFRQIGIYSPQGQQYEPEDKKHLMYYREDQKGQLLQEGISEAGAMSAWVAAATAYAHSQFPLIPFYIYYSMFGYQRFGDLAWAAGDMRSRGFIIGGTAGRTTLAGEGLQHQDGHNILMFSMVPNCVSYDPTFAYEMAVIIHHGLEKMYRDQEDVYFYITAMNENYHHPAMPIGVEDGIIKGLYLFRQGRKDVQLRVQLLGSGTILREVIAAGNLLEKEFNIAADIWSATSFNELRKDIESVQRYNRLHPHETPKESHVERCLKASTGPVIAATDYMKLFADQIRQAISQPYHVLGTDGFGRSDGRAALRDFFEVDAKMIAYTALSALTAMGQWDKERLVAAMRQLNIDHERPDPITV